MNVKVIKVKFSNSNRVYYFLSNELEISKETFVVVESERGLQVGKTCSDVFEISREKIIDSLKKVVRIATEDDLEQNRINLSDAFSAYIEMIIWFLTFLLLMLCMTLIDLRMYVEPSL